LDVIASSNLQHIINGKNSVAINAAMRCCYGVSAVCISNITAVLPNPHIDFMDLRVGINSLQRILKIKCSG